LPPLLPDTDKDTLAFMTPEHVAQYPPRPASPAKLSCYDPVRRVFTPSSPAEVFPGVAGGDKPPALVALLDADVTTNAFVHARRLSTFVRLSRGESLLPEGPAKHRALSTPTAAPMAHAVAAAPASYRGGGERSELDSRRAQAHGPRASPLTVRAVPARRVVVGGGAARIPTEMDLRGAACFGFPLPHGALPHRAPTPTGAAGGLPAPATFPASVSGYQCLGDLAVPDGAKIVRPVAWSPPRGQSFWSASAAHAHAHAKADVDAEIAMICGLLHKGPEQPQPRPQAAPPGALLTPPATPERAVFRRLAPTPIARPAAFAGGDPTTPLSLAQVASPTTVTDPFRAGLSPVHTLTASLGGLEAAASADVCDGGSELDSRAEAYLQTVIAVNKQRGAAGGAPGAPPVTEAEKAEAVVVEHGLEWKGSDAAAHDGRGGLAGLYAPLHGVCRSLFAPEE